MKEYNMKLKKEEKLNIFLIIFLIMVSILRMYFWYYYTHAICNYIGSINFILLYWLFRRMS